MIRRRRRYPTKEIQSKHREMDFLLMLRESDSPPSGSEDSSTAVKKRSSMARRFGSGSSRKPPA
jgi:hypothetical protein